MEKQVSVDIASLLQSQTNTDSWRRRRKMQRVPPQIRRSQQVYDPIMVSIGPYHHGKPELRRAEEFKYLCLDRCAGGDDKKKAFFYSKILDKIKAVRDSYAEASIVDEYDDRSLALMMLLDAAMMVDFIGNFLGKEGLSDWRRCMGAGSWPLMLRDMLVMENQIPLQILKLMISMQYDYDDHDDDERNETEGGVALLSWFIMSLLTCKKKTTLIKLNADILNPKEKDDDPALHFLEALWRAMVKPNATTPSEDDCSGSGTEFVQCGFWMREDDFKPYTHLSVMDLKAKGITLRPNTEISLTDITFKPNYICFSHLHLPVQYVSLLTPVFLANMIAFEVSPDGTDSLVFLSYALFMKSLIQGPEDVKELQERGVLVNRLANLEKVVEVYKEIDTFGLHDQDVFKDVKGRIQEHCSSRARTWIAELIYTRFRTPWTAIAFFAAVFLLCLTFLQTLFTIRQLN